MTERISILIPEECFIMCHIFNVSFEELLQYYIDHINLKLFTEDQEADLYQTATYFFLDFTPTRKAN